MSDFMNALAVGTRARLDREQLDTMERRRSAAPHVSAAIGGDQSAIGRIAEADPDYAMKVGSFVQSLDAGKREVLKQAADFTTRAGMGVLNAPPGERAAAYEMARVEAQSLKIPTENWPKTYDANTERWLRLNTDKAMPFNLWFKNQNKGKAPAPAPYDPPSWATPSAAPGGAPPAPNGGGAPPVGPQASAEPAAGQPAAPPVQMASAPPGFRAMRQRQPDGSVRAATVDGQPVYRDLQTGELTTNVQQASRPPIAEGTGLPVEQGDGGPPGSPSGGGPQQGGVVTAVPQGYEPRTRGGVPEIDKKGFITLISRDGPPLLISARELAKPPKAEKPPAPGGTQGPFAGQGIEGQLYNTILQQKIDTPEYFIAYGRLKRGHTTIGEDGKPLTIPAMDMSAFPVPTYRAPGAPPPPAGATPGIPQPVQGDAIPGRGKGKPLDNSARDDLAKTGGALEMAELLKSFHPSFGGYYLDALGESANFAKRNLPESLGGGDPTGQAQWWQRYQMLSNIERNKLFGASLTAGESAAWKAATITPGMKPDQIETNLRRQSEIAMKAMSRLVNGMVKSGYNQEAIEVATGVRVSDLPDPMGGVPQGAPAAPPPAKGASGRPPLESFGR